jgi:Tfp pilus assembly protein PilO
MLEKLNYNKKSYLLFGGLILFLYFGYQFSFSDTFELVGQIKEKEQKLNWLKEKEGELPALKAKMAEFERAYSKSDSLAVRDKLTAYISDFAEKNNCLVTEIPVNSSFKNDNLKVQTNTFTIRGNFHNLLSLLYKLENDYKYVAKIMSSRFYTIKDMQTKRKNLYMTLITQSFEQKEK